MNNRRRRVPRVLVPVFVALMGLVSLANFADTPGFDTFRAVDVVRLIGVGMCFGAALAALIMMFLGGNRSS